jgi:hypothetical protein
MADSGFGLDPLFRIGRRTKLCDTVFRLRNISDILCGQGRSLTTRLLEDSLSSLSFKENRDV